MRRSTLTFSILLAFILNNGCKSSQWTITNITPIPSKTHLDIEGIWWAIDIPADSNYTFLYFDDAHQFARDTRIPSIGTSRYEVVETDSLPLVILLEGSSQCEFRYRVSDNRLYIDSSVHSSAPLAKEYRQIGDYMTDEEYPYIDTLATLRLNGKWRQYVFTKSNPFPFGERYGDESNILVFDSKSQTLQRGLKGSKVTYVIKKTAVGKKRLLTKDENDRIWQRGFRQYADSIIMISPTEMSSGNVTYWKRL